MALKASERDFTPEVKAEKQQHQKEVTPSLHSSWQEVDQVSLSTQDIIGAIDKDFHYPEKRDSEEQLKDLEAQISQQEHVQEVASPDILASSRWSSSQSVRGEVQGEDRIQDRSPQVQANIRKSADRIVQIGQGHDKNPVANWAQKMINKFLN